MKIWNFGIIGAGLIADFHAKAILSLKNARLTGICGTNQEKVNALAKKYGCRGYAGMEEMLLVGGYRDCDNCNSQRSPYGTGHKSGACRETCDM